MGVFLPGIVVIFFAFSVTVNCDTFPECEGVESKTFVADKSDCESYIYCDDEDSFASKCPTNLRFNVEDGSCDDAEKVECFSNVETTSQTTAKASTDVVSTEIKVTSTESQKTSLKSTLSTLETSKSTQSSGETSQTSTVTAVSVTTSSNAKIICPETLRVDDIIYLPSPDLCSEYFMCYRGTPIPMTCPNDLEFNSLKASCDWAYLANCRIVGTTTTSPRELCTGHTSGYFPYSSNCQYYYRCMNGMLTIQECPLGFGWDTDRKMCSSTACRKSL